MAKCGHIFCLPCLIRYMASVDADKAPEKRTRYKKCVICTDSVYLNDIRPVRFFIGQQNEPPKDGEDVILRLVMRRPGSTVALPKDGAELPTELSEIPWHFAAEVMDYARVMKGTKSYMREQFTREIRELEQMQEHDEVMFGEEGIWSRKAVGMIKTQMEALTGMANPPELVIELPKLKEKEKEKKPPIVFTENTADVPAMYHIFHEARSGHSSQSHTPGPQSERPSTSPNPDSVMPTSFSDSKTPQSLVTVPRAANVSHDSSYYFYQALLHYYLSPLDIRILKVAFGSFAAFPSTILPRVENVSTGHIVDDELRKRARYLAHLPYGCEVGFLECDWTNIVPPETLEKFRPDIERRRKMKKDKDTKEERDRLRAERLEDDEKWAAVRHRRRPSIVEGESGFFKEDDFIALGHELRHMSVSVGDSYDGEISSSAMDHSESGPNGETPSASTSPSAHARSLDRSTVWGTPAISNGAPLRREDPTGWLPDWERELLLEEDMFAQIEMEESGGGSNNGGGRAPNQGKGQKKKKFKKVTLMTNGGKRGA